jgi:hypothetical protein
MLQSHNEIFEIKGSEIKGIKGIKGVRVTLNNPFLLFTSKFKAHRPHRHLFKLNP